MNYHFGDNLGDNNFIRMHSGLLEPIKEFKITIVGSSQTGKSSIIHRFIRGTFDDNMSTTIGAAFICHKMIVQDGNYVKLNIWDTAGQERYNSLVPMYLRDSIACILVYDITDYHSFEKIKHWYGICVNSMKSNSILYLVANKNDLPDHYF